MKVDILIRAKDGAAMTLACLESIAKNTPREMCRIILVDDGSDPALDLPADVLIRCSESRGAVTATNLGLAASMIHTDSPYVLILDNDTRIPDGDSTWLHRFIQALEDGGPVTACVGATTHRANPPQQILAVPQSYTADWKDDNGREGFKDNPPVVWFVSFACLLRKEVIGRVGFWDERYNPGNFEDTDYAVRLREAGYEIRVAQSVYIHHDCHQTFSNNLQRLLDVNGKKFREKWGLGRLWDMGIVDGAQLKAVL